MRKKRIKRIGIWSIVLLILGSIFGYVGIHHMAPYAITQPGRVSLELTPSDLELKSVPLDLEVADSIRLNGHWIESNLKDTKGIMILVHGVGGCKEHFIPLAKDLADMGVASIVFDGRAHGKSGGEFCTYGFHEKKDVSRIVDHIKEKNDSIPLGIWGNSLGGAIAIQALEYDERIEFGIIESTFTDLETIVFDYKKRFLKGIGVRSLSDHALKRAGEVANFDPTAVRPLESVKHIEQPVLISHGDADERISFEYGEQLFEALKSEEKQFIRVEGGRHLGMFEVGGEPYKQELYTFIEKNLENAIREN